MAETAYNFDIEKIQDTVWVFKKAIKNPESFIKYFEENKKWKDWYTLGRSANGTLFSTSFDTFPTEEEWKRKKHESPHNDFKSPGYYENKINDLFYNTTRLYVEENNLVFDNWIYNGWGIAKYIPDPQDNTEYAMFHHTDFQRELAYNPGSKFAITVVFYLNDNYDGGDVMFRFLDDNDMSIIKEDYSYKPQAGDIVVFMSGHPHYHGVKKVSNGEKYIIRAYWKYDYLGHPLWLKLQEKYGEDVWRQLEKERLRFSRNTDNIKMINNVQFWIEFEEYYKKELGSLD
jgi:hypothetical protein